MNESYCNTRSEYCMHIYRGLIACGRPVSDHHHEQVPYDMVLVHDDDLARISRTVRLLIVIPSLNCTMRKKNHCMAKMRSS